MINSYDPSSEVVPIKFWEWWSTLTGGDFVFYLDKLVATIAALHARSGGRPLALVSQGSARPAAHPRMYVYACRSVRCEL